MDYGNQLLPRFQFSHFIDKVTVNRHFDSFKGQEISKAIFLETPLPKKRPKFFSALASKMDKIKNNKVSLI